MKKLFVLLLIFSIQVVHAALHPKYQNKKDLQVMVTFVESHEKVLTTLESIDFKHFTVYYNNGCKALFGRKYIYKAPGWAGPADPLEFKRSTCKIE